MNKSDHINELASALSKLQGEIIDASKDKKGYGYYYADLSQVLEISRPLLLKHKLALPQLCGASEGKVSVETLLIHESGQWISSTIEMPVEVGKNMSRAQAVGSVITYARRYGIVSMLGIAQADNDASIEESVPKINVEQNSKQVVRKITRDQETIIRDLLNESTRTIDQLKEWAKMGSISDIPVEKFDTVLKWVKAGIKSEEDDINPLRKIVA